MNDLGLSILLPAYNNVCLPLVEILASQCRDLAGRMPSDCAFDYEIIVADDGSTDAAVIEQNKKIGDIGRCRYIIRGYNSGRSQIRNFLAREASFPWLLFIDSDMMVEKSDFVASYLDAVKDGGASARVVVNGGVTISSSAPCDDHNLRYIYELDALPRHTAEKRREREFADFHTANFLVGRDLMLSHPFDERFHHYGYEDVLFGKALKADGTGIRHIDNPVSFIDFESNEHFVEKTEEGLRTLAEFSDDLQGYSAVLSMADRLRKIGIAPIARCFFSMIRKPIRRNLTGSKPCLTLFRIYKLGYLLTLKNK